MANNKFLVIGTVINETEVGVLSAFNVLVLIPHSLVQTPS